MTDDPHRFAKDHEDTRPAMSSEENKMPVRIDNQNYVLKLKARIAELEEEMASVTVSYDDIRIRKRERKIGYGFALNDALALPRKSHVFGHECIRASDIEALRGGGEVEMITELSETDREYLNNPERLKARIAELERDLQQCHEAYRAKEMNVPLGPIIGAHTIMNQQIRIKTLEGLLEEWVRDYLLDQSNPNYLAERTVNVLQGAEE